MFRFCIETLPVLVKVNLAISDAYECPFNRISTDNHPTGN